MLDTRRIEAFLDTLRAERGAADNTIEAYRRDLEDASEFLRANRTSLIDAGERDLSAFVRDLHERKMSPATVSRRLSALRRFFRFQLGDNERKDDPTSRLDGPTFTRAPPDVLSREEVARLIEAAQKGNGKGPSRRTSAPSASSSCSTAPGLRASECCDLPLSALPAPGTSVLIVRGKGDKERIAPLGKPALQALKAYMAVRETFLPKSAVRSTAQRFVFPSRGSGGRLTRRRLGQILEDLAMKAGIDRSSASRRTRCAMPSPPTCFPAAPTFAPSSCFSATPTSRPRRSTPTSSRTNCATCWKLRIRWRGRTEQLKRL